MLLDPLLLMLDHMVDLRSVLDKLLLFLLKVANIVSEQIVGDYKGFLTFGTLLSGIRDTI